VAEKAPEKELDFLRQYSFHVGGKSEPYHIKADTARLNKLFRLGKERGSAFLKSDHQREEVFRKNVGKSWNVDLWE